MREIPVRGPLECPRDRTPLRPFRIGEIEVDTCLTCTGTWLDAGELARVAHDHELETIVNAARETRASPFPCPRCAGVCHPATVEGVELDACSKCGGIWLDTRELHDARTRVLLARGPAGRAGIRSLLGAAATPRA